jgi:hypothetical protein
MISRRKLIAGSIAVIASPRLAHAGVTLHPDPSGDDWAQITAALATLRANRMGWIELEQISSSVNFNIKKSVNATGLWASSIRFAPGVIVRSDGFTGDGTGRPAPMFDFSNSELSEIICDGNSAAFIEGIDTQSPAGTVKPNCAILIANGDGKRIENMCTNGAFGSAAVGLVNCSSIQIVGGGLGSVDPATPTLVMSISPDWGLWSPYTTFGTSGICNDIRVECELHGLGRQPWTVYMRGVNNVLFEGCLCDNNARAQVLAQGTNNGVTFVSGKSYSELGVGLTGVVECGSPDSMTNLKFIGYGNGSIPHTIGSGSFAGLQII